MTVQVAGVTILLMNMIPLYRLMAVDFPNYRPELNPSWAIVGVLLAQSAYWSRVRLQPPLPRTRSVVLGHIVSFVARLGFIAPASAFTVMFLNRYEALKAMNYSPFRALASLVVFFSLFCWTLELERLARSFQGGIDETRQTSESNSAAGIRRTREARDERIAEEIGRS